MEIKGLLKHAVKNQGNTSHMFLMTLCNYITLCKAQKLILHKTAPLKERTEICQQSLSLWFCLAERKTGKRERTGQVGRYTGDSGNRG